MEKYLFVYKAGETLKTEEVVGRENAKDTASRIGEGLVFKDGRMYSFIKEQYQKID
jgi:hypothetical protein